MRRFHFIKQAHGNKQQNQDKCIDYGAVEGQRRCRSSVKDPNRIQRDGRPSAIEKRSAIECAERVTLLPVGKSGKIYETLFRTNRLHWSIGEFVNWHLTLDVEPFWCGFKKRYGPWPPAGWKNNTIRMFIRLLNHITTVWQSQSQLSRFLCGLGLVQYVSSLLGCEIALFPLIRGWFFATSTWSLSTNKKGKQQRMIDGKPMVRCTGQWTAMPFGSDMRMVSMYSQSPTYESQLKRV